jgi:hypothetical protein
MGEVGKIHHPKDLDSLLYILESHKCKEDYLEYHDQRNLEYVLFCDKCGDKVIIPHSSEERINAECFGVDFRNKRLKLHELYKIMVPWGLSFRIDAEVEES